MPPSTRIQFNVSSQVEQKYQPCRRGLIHVECTQAHARGLFTLPLLRNTLSETFGDSEKVTDQTNSSNVYLTLLVMVDIEGAARTSHRISLHRNAILPSSIQRPHMAYSVLFPPES